MTSAKQTTQAARSSKLRVAIPIARNFALKPAHLDVQNREQIGMHPTWPCLITKVTTLSVPMTSAKQTTQDARSPRLRVTIPIARNFAVKPTHLDVRNPIRQEMPLREKIHEVTQTLQGGRGLLLKTWRQGEQCLIPKVSTLSVPMTSATRRIQYRRSPRLRMTIQIARNFALKPRNQAW